jgi:hypothetical protein
MSFPPPPRFEIVPREPRMPRWLLAVLMLVLGLAIGGGALWWWHKPAPGTPAAQLAETTHRLAEQQQVIGELQQRVATLSRSDQISRDANRDVQDMLAEKDAEIASLRGDVAFYERFVGSSGPRKGLSVHSAEFAPEAGGSWRYEVVVTQSLNRGGLTQGDMRFSLEGVRNGKLTTVNWDELQQKPDAPGQHYSFRYFQRLGGSVILPQGFTAQRVKVSLRGNGANVEQAFAWTRMTIPGGN